MFSHNVELISYAVCLLLPH